MKKRILWMVSTLLLATALSAQSNTGFVIAPWESVIFADTSGIGVDACGLNIGFDFLTANCSFDGDQFVRPPGLAIQYSTAVDPGQFLPRAHFRLVANFEVFANHTTCLRLYDVAGGVPVAGSQICQTADPTDVNGHFYRAESAPFLLPEGSRVYAIQGKDNVIDPEGPATPNGVAFLVRIIAER